MMTRKNNVRLTPLVIWLLPICVLLIAACDDGVSLGRDPRLDGKTVPMPTDVEIDPRWAQLGSCQLMDQGFDRRKDCWTVEAAKLPPFGPARPEHFGELYDPQKYLECKIKSRGSSGCDQHALRRPENPEYWPPGSKKIKWPEPPKENVYRAGMSGREYFAALCQAEAGEFIYKTVENVEGIYQIRPRVPQESNPELMDRYVMEDPYGYTSVDAAFADHPSTLFVNPPWKLYRYFERHETADSFKYAKNDHERMKGDLNGEGYYRYYAYQQEISQSPSFPQRVPRAGNPMQRNAISAPQSRYGFTWRGISRPHDREFGIAGGELAVVDMQTGETLGLRRGFIYSATKGNKATWWLAGAVCPRLTDARGSKAPEFTYWFVSKVAKPIQSNTETQEGYSK